MKKHKVEVDPVKGLFHSCPEPRNCDCEYPMVMRKGFGGDKQVVVLHLCCMAKLLEAQHGVDLIEEYTAK